MSSRRPRSSMSCARNTRRRASRITITPTSKATSRSTRACARRTRGSTRRSRISTASSPPSITASTSGTASCSKDALRARLRRAARAAHRRLPGDRRDQHLLRDRGGEAADDRGRAGRRADGREGARRRRACNTPASAWRTTRASVRKCVITVPPAIPAKVGFTVDYQTGIVTVHARQRRPLRPREPRVPQPVHRRAGARRPPEVHPRPRLVVPAPRAARGAARHAQGNLTAAMAACGLDFGTSNSGVALVAPRARRACARRGRRHVDSQRGLLPCGRRRSMRCTAAQRCASTSTARRAG